MQHKRHRLKITRAYGAIVFICGFCLNCLAIPFLPALKIIAEITTKAAGIAHEHSAADKAFLQAVHSITPFLYLLTPLFEQIAELFGNK